MSPASSPLPPAPAPHRLGVHLTEGGASVAVWAGHATGVDLCLFDEAGAETRLPLNGPQWGVWHAFVPGLAAGQRYGFRAFGPWQPKAGLRYNPAKLLLDPYGRGLEGDVVPVTEPGASTLRVSREGADSAPFMPRSVITSPRGEAHAPSRPGTPWTDTVIYEVHVKGFTRTMPGIPEELRGTYAGLAHPASIDYLTSLGVTAVELLPVHAFASEPHLEELGLSNYWGYSTLGFFAPHAAYATAAARAQGAQAVQEEFRGMVDLLHAAGLEVLLDVVYNHTAEGGRDDRVLSWRGLDSLSYYRHQPLNPQMDDDTTGTGNALDFSHPTVVKMALDSLRYWATEMGVDGYRFDLAVTLGRTAQGFSSDHPFLVALTTDPVLSGLKLIAEPWDVGLGGWQVGNFPAPMSEWNDRFRDYVRSFWLEWGVGLVGHREHATAPELATRLAGSSDLFGHTEPHGLRGPVASVNFVTAHDGFTVHDLTAYTHKHNEDNREGNRDGTDNNRAYNHGAEGPSDDAAVLRARRRSMRNLLGTLLLSAGTPMLLAGDEFGRSQRGNNNAYCQDNELSWFDWNWEPWQAELRDTVAYLIGLRQRHRVLRPSTFYDGEESVLDASRQRADSAWFQADGSPQDEKWWEDPATRVVQFMRSVLDPAESDALMVINGSREQATVTLPEDDGHPWRLAWDSSWESPAEYSGVICAPGSSDTMQPMTLRLYLAP